MNWNCLRLIFSIVALIVICFWGKAQSAKSDSLFAKGVELHQMGKYREAVPVFAESDRLDKAELDSASNRRDYAAMWLANCYYLLGDTARAKKEYAYYRVPPVDRRLTVLSDSLSAVGVKLYQDGDYEAARKYILQCADIEKKQLGENSFFYGNSLRNYARISFFLNDSTSAIKYLLKSEPILASCLSVNSKEYAYLLSEIGWTYQSFQFEDNRLKACRYLLKADSIAVKLDNYDTNEIETSIYNLSFDIGKELMNAGQYEKAILYLEQAYKYALKVHDKYDTEFPVGILDLLGSSYSAMGNNEEAVRLATEALQIRERVLGKEHPDYAISLINLASYNYFLCNFGEAVHLGTEALQIQEHILGKVHPVYATSLTDLTYYNFALGNFGEAVRLGTEALQIQERILGKVHPSYATLLNHLAQCNSMLGNYDEALRLGNETLKIREQVLGKEHPDYATSLSDLANFNSHLGNYGEALRLGTEALQIRERVLGKEHPDYATSLSDLAIINSHLGNYGEALRLGTEALKIRERVLGKEHLLYATSLSNLASCNYSLGNYGEALRLGTEALQIKERVLGKEHQLYATSLSDLANFNSHLGNYGEALRLGNEALQIQERVLGKEHPDYATLITLAVLKSKLGNYGEAVRLATEALQIQERVLGKEHPDYATALITLAVLKSDLGNYGEAVRLETEALKIYEKVFGKEHPDYATSLNNMASYNYYLGNYDEAVRLATEALQIQERVLGKEHPDYVHNLYFLAGAKVNRKDRKGEVSTYYYSQWFSALVKMLRSQFSTLTENERALFFVGRYEKSLTEAHRVAYRYANDTVKEIGYDAALLSKGILLNTSQEMRQLIMNSNDSKMLSVYDNFRTNRLMLDRLLEKPLNERHLSVDSLENVVSSLERELIANSKEFGDYTRNMQINWRDVQSKMGTTDVCIEFVSFALGSDSIMYAAYVLKKDMNCPVFVKLFEQKQLQSLPKKDYYSTSGVASLVWKPIAEYLQGASCVYFAPAGEMYNIAIENIPSWDSANLMSERWNLYRLSSTRQLAVARDKKVVKQAQIYGGIQYNTSDDVLIADSKKRSRKRSMDDEWFSLADSLNLRAGVALLPATREEAMQIEATLKNVKIMTALRTDTLATEGDFKDMSASEVNLVHIATHGFYWTEREASKFDDKLSFLMTAAERPHYVEDKAMTRSGLLFAGANYALTGNKLPEGVDDGILTAKEISRLNLRNVDMVVLSACQTGLGDLKGDGVFGLQRGLKKAGVNTIMMSLWKVDDKATELLMEQFYKNLASGMNKFESLRQSQKFVREYEVEVEASQDGRKQLNANRRQQANAAAKDKSSRKIIRPYDSPHYWAAFILLDADLFVP